MKFPALFNRERVADIYDFAPYQEIVDGTMFLEDGRTEVGVGVDLLPHHFGPSPERFTNTLGALCRLTPQRSRLRYAVQVVPEDAEVIHAYRAGCSDTSRASHVLTEGRASYLAHLRARGEVRRWHAHLSLAQGKPKKAKAAVSQLSTAEALERSYKLELLLTRQARLAGLNPRTLTTDDVFERTFRYLNPSYGNVKLGPYIATEKDYPAEAVAEFEGLKAPTLRAQLLKSSVDNVRKPYLQVGGHCVTMIVLCTEPERVSPGLGDLLTRARVPFTFVLDVWHEDQTNAIGRVKNRNRRAFSDMQSSQQGHYTGPESGRALGEGERLVNHLYETGDHVYRVMNAIILTHADVETLQDAIDTLMSELNSVPGMPYRKLEQGLLVPFLTFAPFSGRTHDEGASLVETHAKRMFPVHGPWLTDLRSERAVALYHTRDHTLVAVDSWDPKNKNPHTAFLGAPRVGKTFTAQYQFTETLRDEDVDGVVIDVGLNWKRTVEHYGGPVVRVDTSGRTSKNPFDLQPGQLEPSEDDRTFLLNLLRVMLPGDDPVQIADEDSVLISAIAEVYSAHLTEYKIKEDEYGKRLRPFVLSDFVETLETLSGVGERSVTAEDKKIASGLARRLQKWTGDSPLGRFLDRPTTLPVGDHKAILYETSAFGDDEDLRKVGTMLIQRAVWQRTLRTKRKRTNMVVDEAWLSLQDDFASAYLEEILRRGAKEGLALWLITHSVEDLAKRKAIRQALTNFFVMRLDGEDDLLAGILGVPPDTLAEYRTVSGETGVYNEFLFFTRNEQETVGDILVLRVSPTDYYLFTSHLGDLAQIEALTEELGSEEAAIAALVQQRLAA